MIVRLKWKPGGNKSPRPADRKEMATNVADLSPADAPVHAGEMGIIGNLMIEAFGASDPGCVRSNNEDCFLVAPRAGIYLVADGMGGAQAGEQAAKMATETIWEIVSAERNGMDADKLVAAFHEASSRIKAAADSHPELQGMGTTLVAAVEREGELMVASVGDSRVYVFEGGQVHAITDDQTWVNEVGRKLGLDEDSLKTHPMRHVLTMALGVSEQLRVNTYHIKPAAGSQVLLCSDGLHGILTEHDLAEALSQPGTVEQRCHRLIALARERGAPDNVTAVLLEARNR
jgi:protein phosphatase